MKKRGRAPSAGRTKTGKRDYWVINHYPDGKSRARLYFASRAERDAKLKEMRGHHAVLADKAIAGATPDLVLIGQAVREALKGEPLSKMLDLWRRHHALASCSVKTAAEDYLKTKADAIDKGNTHSLIALDAFRAWLKDDERQICEVSRKEIIAYFDHLKTERSDRSGEPFTATTIRNRHKILHAWFNHCRTRELVTDNPVRDIPLPEVGEKEIEILSVPEVFSLLHAARLTDAPMSQLLALGAFAGVRTESILKLAAEDIHPGDGINFPAKKFKTRTTHFATGLPDNLWPWISDIKAGRILGIKKRAFEARRTRIAESARLKLPANWARHSFATYFSALHGDVNKAAAVLGHRGTEMTWKHYKGRAGEFEAKVYFSLTPEMISEGATPEIFEVLFKVLKDSMARRRLGKSIKPASLTPSGMTKGADDSYHRSLAAVEKALLPLVDKEVARMYHEANYGPNRVPRNRIPIRELKTLIKIHRPESEE